jgi:hypothetical protein
MLFRVTEERRLARHRSVPGGGVGFDLVGLADALWLAYWTARLLKQPPAR